MVATGRGRGLWQFLDAYSHVLGSDLCPYREIWVHTTAALLNHCKLAIIDNHVFAMSEHPKMLPVSESESAFCDRILGEAPESVTRFP